MATQLQIRRGTNSQVAAFTGAEGEIVVNTTNDSVHVNDGSTAGGFEMARADLNNVSDTSLNAALTGNTVSALTITTLTLGSTAITATGTELNYVDGVTSAIQTQIDTKAPLASPTFTGTVTVAGLTTTADVSFGDNDKAIFGAGSDLKIYHDGSNSYVNDVGTGDLILKTAGAGVQMWGDGDVMLNAVKDGAVTLYHDNAAKIATTATGIDVTGTVTADGVVTQATANTYPGGAAIIKSLAGDASYITNVGGSFLISNNSSSDQFTLTSAGNVGIGTSSPSTKLQVTGNSSSRNTIVSNVTLDGGTTVAYPYSGFGFGINFIGRDYGNAVRNYASINTVMEASSSSSGGGDAGFKAGLSFYTNGGGASDTDPQERMRISSAGAVGIGATSVDANIKLQLEESDTTPVFVKTKNSAGSLIVGNNSSGNSYVSSQTSGKPLIFETENTERMRIGSSGHITSLPTWNNGSASSANMVVNSSGLFLKSVSSAKYKTDIEDVQDAYVDSLLNIRPVYYRSTLENDNTEHSHWGFIAEEVAEIDPRLVHYKTVDVSYGDDGERVETELETPEPEGVQYDRFAPLMLKLIQKQQATITALTARIEQLENN